MKKDPILTENLIWKLAIVLFSVLVIGISIFIFAYREVLWCYVTRCHNLFMDNDRIGDFITSFGMAAPVIFILIQIFQVLFAPIPGEASGFIGGYLFGTFPGFIYSTIGLSLGSWMNLVIGRTLGRRFVRRLISQKRLERFDRILKRQGVIIFFILFVFPGFPKDYLCFFLGLSNVPFRVLFLIASVGRIPGTFLLSLQGAYLFEKNYTLLFGVIGLCLIIAFFSYRYKKQIYQWVEKFNGDSV